MELMSTALYCVLLLLPQALANENDQRKHINDISSEKTKDPSVTRSVSDLAKVFTDEKCYNCIDCMERAIKAHKVHGTEFVNPDTVHNDMEYLESRFKRENNLTNGFKRKARKKTVQKSVTVTKYSRDGEVYALKVKEGVKPDDETKKAADTYCRVYKVKKSYKCDSPEGELILSIAKKKNSKKTSKKDIAKKVPNTATTTEVVPKSTTVSKKREVEHSQMPNTHVVENYMPSIELY